MCNTLLFHFNNGCMNAPQCCLYKIPPGKCRGSTSDWNKKIHSISSAIRYSRIIKVFNYTIILPWRNSPFGPRPPHYWGFMIILRHTTLCRTPLDEWSVRRRVLYLTTHNNHNRETSMRRAGFEPSHSKRAAAEPRLRKPDHWDRPTIQCKI